MISILKQIATFTLASVTISLSSCSDGTYDLYVGTFGENIYEVRFDGKTFETLGTMEMEDPSYLAFGEKGELLSPSHKYPGAYFCAFEGGSLTARCDELGEGPAHIWHAEGTPFNIISEYRGGSISVIRCEGMECSRVQFIRYEGSGPDPKRQRSPHVHQAKEIPAAICKAAGIEGRWILACDLGLDCLHVLGFEAEAQQPLTDCPSMKIDCGPASGPRHMEFNPAAQMLYVLTELSNEVIAWKISADAEGRPLFSPVQRFEVPGAGFQGGGDIHLSPDGKFLYSSHRCGNDGIAAFRVLPDGSFSFTEYVNTAEHPRNFCITPDGRYLLAACKNDRCIEVFKRDRSSGRIKADGLRMEFSGDEPVCLLPKD